MSNNAVTIVINALDKASATIKSVGGAMEGIGRSMKNAEQGSKMLMGGVVATTAAFAALGTKAVFELAEIERINAQTEAVIASTGGAANVTAKEIEDMALALQWETSVAHEATRQGANLLLTFTNIRNEAGEGNDIFNQAVRIMTDLSVAMGIDSTSAATMLGKALNDPKQGITALSRVGVSFTDEQKEMVESMVEAGDIMGAQKLILEELETQYGGSAKALGETFVGKLEIAKMAFADIWQAIADGFGVLDWLKDGLDTLTEIFWDFTAVVEQDGLKTALRTIFPEEMDGIIWAVGGAIAIGLVPALWSMAAGVWAALAPLLPFLAAGAALGALAYTIYQNWEQFEPMFSTMFSIVKDVAVGFFDTFMDSVGILWESFQPIWESLKRLFESLTPIIELVGAVLGVLLVTALAVFNGMIAAIGPLINAFINIMEVVVNVVMTIVALLTGDMDAALEYWNKAVEATKEFFLNIWEAIKNFFTGFVDTFINILSNFGIDVREGFSDMWERVKEIVRNGIDKVIEFFSELPGKVWEKVLEVSNKVREGFNKAMDNAKTAVTDGINTVIDTILSFGTQFFDAGKGLITGFADGIKNAFGAARDAVSNGLKTVRNLLPFSPAKEGPLSDLDKSGESFFPTFAEGMAKQVDAAQKVARQGLDDIDLSTEFTGGRQRVNFHVSGRSTVVIELNGDGNRLSPEEIEELKRELQDYVDDRTIDAEKLRQIMRSR